MSFLTTSLDAIQKLADTLFPQLGKTGPEPLVATFARATLDGPLVYKAMLSQTGSNPPVVTKVLTNSLNANPVFTYVSTGKYNVLIPNGFPVGKSIVSLVPQQRLSLVSGDALESASTSFVDTSNVTLLVVAGGSAEDDILGDTPIEILIYP